MHRRDDEAAEHEEDIDRDIARPEKPAGEGIAEVGELELQMVTDDPERREAADRGERQVVVPERRGRLVAQERASASMRAGSTVTPWPRGPWPPPRPGAARMAAAT